MSVESLVTAYSIFSPRPNSAPFKLNGRLRILRVRIRAEINEESFDRNVIECCVRCWTQGYSCPMLARRLKPACLARSAESSCLTRVTTSSFEEDSGVLGVKKELNCVPILLGLMQKSIYLSYARFAIYVHIFTITCFVPGFLVVNASIIEDFTRGVQSKGLKFIVEIAPIVWTILIAAESSGRDCGRCCRFPPRPACRSCARPVGTGPTRRGRLSTITAFRAQFDVMLGSARGRDLGQP